MACGLMWAGATAAGTRAMLNYENRPGPAGESPKVWPADSAIQRPSGLPMLVVFGHPHCPCTRATIGELALIMARLKGQLSAEVVFIKPGDTSENWERTDLWSSAASIPGVRVISDAGGIEADRFHAQISGQTMLYSSGGNLLFSGGITASRGHSGDNAGRTAVVDLVTGG
jgi:hypothetical protein